MIQVKAKNKYWQAGKRWQRLWATPLEFARLDFENYQYIIGDKIYTEANEESEEAFNMVTMWSQLQSTK